MSLFPGPTAPPPEVLDWWLSSFGFWPLEERERESPSLCPVAVVQPLALLSSSAA
jgi:hypothetical protein